MILINYFIPKLTWLQSIILKFIVNLEIKMEKGELKWQIILKSQK